MREGERESVVCVCVCVCVCGCEIVYIELCERESVSVCEIVYMGIGNWEGNESIRVKMWREKNNVENDAV